MKTTKRKALERAGWRTGSADEFLGLKAEETTLVTMRLSLAEKLRGRRTKLGLSQTDLATRLGSSQSRVAKMEAGEADVSLDLLVRAMLNTGASAREVAHAIAAA
jgi:ribosome-binding protein aMBF1 (putative translation factor)